ncbi:hypothetical protein Hanom_Chr16g01502221 [Helianthus anomalus]
MTNIPFEKKATINNNLRTTTAAELSISPTPVVGEDDLHLPSASFPLVSLLQNQI